MITAAHCTDGLCAEQIQVRVGDTTLDEEFEATSFTIDVATIKQHPDFNYFTLTNDIAILELTEPVSLTAYPNIKPACLPEAGALFPGEAIVSGWGKVAQGSHATSSLYEVGVTVFADGDCGNVNSEMTEDMICAGVMVGGKGTCQGDSGGPLVAEDPARNNSMSLIGVVSFAEGCAARDNLTVYAEVSHFIDWLGEQMPNLNTCPPPPEGWNSISVTTDGNSTSVPDTTTTRKNEESTNCTSASVNSTTTTINNEGSCGNCVFPFINEGRLSDRCTTINKDSTKKPPLVEPYKPWCASVSQGIDGLMMTGEYCIDPSCPGLKGNSEEMSVHPKNAVGNCCKFLY